MNTTCLSVVPRIHLTKFGERVEGRERRRGGKREGGTERGKEREWEWERGRDRDRQERTDPGLHPLRWHTQHQCHEVEDILILSPVCFRSLPTSVTGCYPVSMICEVVYIALVPLQYA